MTTHRSETPTSGSEDTTKRRTETPTSGSEDMTTHWTETPTTGSEDRGKGGKKIRENNLRESK